MQEVGAVISRKWICSHATRSVSHQQSAARDALCILLCSKRENTLRAFQSSRVNFKKGRSIVRRKPELQIFWIRTRLHFFETDVGQLYTSFWLRRRWLDPSPAHSQVLFSVDHPSPQCRFLSFPSDNSIRSLHLVLCLLNQRPADSPNSLAARFVALSCSVLEKSSFFRLFF